MKNPKVNQHEKIGTMNTPHSDYHQSPHAEFFKTITCSSPETSRVNDLLFVLENFFIK